MTHEHRHAEKLALAWHFFGVVASAWMTQACLWAAWNVLPLAMNSPPPYGSIFGSILHASLLSAFIAFWGIVWHLWATFEHLAKVRRA